MLKQLSSAAVLLAALTAQTQAGVSPPVISGTYYEQNGTASCPPAPSSSSGSSGEAPPTVSTCQLLYPAPPPGKQLALKSVACHIQFRVFGSTFLKGSYLAQNVGGSIQRTRPLDNVFKGQDSNYYYYTIDRVLDDTYLVASPVRVVIDTSIGTYMSMSCQITGTLQSTPAP